LEYKLRLATAFHRFGVDIKDKKKIHSHVELRFEIKSQVQESFKMYQQHRMPQEEFR